jgi:hypothetical protein
MATARLPGMARRWATGLLALGFLTVTLVATHDADTSRSKIRRRLTERLNTAITWANLDLGLSPHEGAERAVRLDPALRTRLGRRGARWLATDGTLSERLRWAAALARRDPVYRPLLRDAAAAARCSPDRRLRAAAVTALAQARLRAQKGRTRC